MPTERESQMSETLVLRRVDVHCVTNLSGKGRVMGDEVVEPESGERMVPVEWWYDTPDAFEMWEYTAELIYV